MAALKSIRDITDNFEQELTCSICHDIFTDPKTLPCLHSYCTRCIAQWYARSGDQVDKKMNCPMCNTTIPVPDDDPSKLCSSFYLDSLLQLLHAMKSKANQTGLPDCVNCEQPQVLVAFCPQCNGFLCEDCVNLHKKVKQMRDEHQPTMFNQFQKENVTSFIKSNMLCKEKFHEKNKLEYYCQEETCRLSICQKCAILYHQNHQMQSLEEAGADAERMILAQIDGTKQLIEKYKQKLEQSKKNMERIENVIDEAKRKVEDAVEMICITTKFKEHGRAMMDELNQTLEERRTTYNEEQMDINTGIEKLNEFVHHCQALVDRGAAYEEIESKEVILERGQMFSETPSILCSKPIQRNVTIDYSVTGQVMQSLQDMGKAVKSVTDPAQSTIESLKKGFNGGFTNECKIITRNKEGKVCPTRIESIDIRIKDVDGDEVEKKVFEEQTGKYRVRYKALKTGPHKIQVNIGGERVKNSPQNVDMLDVKELFKPVKTFGGRGTGMEQLNVDLLFVKKLKKLVKTFGVRGTCKEELNPSWPLAYSDNGEIAIADFDNHRIQIFSLDGNYLREFGSKGTGEDRLYHPCGVVFNEDRIIVSDRPDGKRRLQEYDLNGTYVRTIYRPEGWFEPHGMCVNDDKNIAVCCWGNQELGIKPSIKVFSKQGDLVHDEFDIPDNNEQPEYITYGNGKYFVSCDWENYVRVFDVNGVFLYKFGEKGERDGQFNGVFGLAVYGPDMILVCDADNHRVQLFTQEGQFIRSFGSRGSGVGQMNYPIDVVVTADGRVFVLENGGNRVSVWC